MRIFFLLFLAFAPFAFSVKVFEEAGVEAYLEEARVANPSKGQDTIYFVMEKMPKKKHEQSAWLSFWENYTKKDKNNFLLSPHRFVLKGNLPRDAAYAGYSSFEMFFESFSYNQNFNEARTENNEFWVSYITPERPTQPAFKTKDSFTAEMTMGVVTHPGAPVVMHMGFQRSFDYRLKQGVSHKGICLPLNGFVASVLRERDPNKTYMISAPTPKLFETFMKAPDLKGGVWEDLNQAPLQFEHEGHQRKWDEIQTGFQSVQMDLDVLAAMVRLPNYTPEDEEKAFALERERLITLKEESGRKKNRRRGRGKKETRNQFDVEHQQEYEALEIALLEEGQRPLRKQKEDGLRAQLEGLFEEKKHFLGKGHRLKALDTETGSPFLKDDDDEMILVSRDGRSLLLHASFERTLDKAFVYLPGQEPGLVEGKEGLNDLSYFSKSARSSTQKVGSLAHCYGFKRLVVDCEALSQLFLKFQKK